jgi:outer membrane protein
VEAFERSVEASRQGVRVAQSGYWPSLSLSFGYGSDWSSEARQPIPGTGSEPRVITITPDDGGEPVTFPVPGTGSDPEFMKPSLMDQLNLRRGGSVRLSLSYPLFDRLQTRTNVQQAETQLLNAQYDLQEQRQLVALQVRQAVLDHRSARSSLAAAEERLQAASEARDAARRRYELGAATFVEVAQAESGYVAARSARVRAGYDVILTRKLIDYYTGSLEPDAPLFDTGGDE